MHKASRVWIRGRERRMALARGRIRKLTLIGELRSFSSETAAAAPVSRFCSDNYVSTAAASTTRYIQHLVRCEKHTGIVYKCLEMISIHSVFDSYSHHTKLKILSTAFDQIRHYPQADPFEVFLMKIYLRSMGTDDGKNRITRDEVKSRVLDVFQSYPKAANYKVTEETHLHYDLGFDELDANRVLHALCLEFKIDLDGLNNMSNVEDAVDDIYENREGREDLESFRKTDPGDMFWPV